MPKGSMSRMATSIEDSVMIDEAAKSKNSNRRRKIWCNIVDLFPMEIVIADSNARVKTTE